MGSGAAKYLAIATFSLNTTAQSDPSERPDPQIACEVSLNQFARPATAQVWLTQWFDHEFCRVAWAPTDLAKLGESLDLNAIDGSGLVNAVRELSIESMDRLQPSFAVRFDGFRLCYYRPHLSAKGELSGWSGNRMLHAEISRYLPRSFVAQGYLPYNGWVDSQVATQVIVKNDGSICHEFNRNGAWVSVQARSVRPDRPYSVLVGASVGAPQEVYEVAWAPVNAINLTLAS